VPGVRIWTQEGDDRCETEPDEAESGRPAQRNARRADPQQGEGEALHEQARPHGPADREVHGVVGLAREDQRERHRGRDPGGSRRGQTADERGGAPLLLVQGTDDPRSDSLAERFR